MYVYNKIDSISLEEVDRLANQDNSVVISCEMGLKYVVSMHYFSSAPKGKDVKQGRMLTDPSVTVTSSCSLDYLKEMIWEYLALGTSVLLVIRSAGCAMKADLVDTNPNNQSKFTPRSEEITRISPIPCVCGKGQPSRSFAILSTGR